MSKRSKFLFLLFTPGCTWAKGLFIYFIAFIAIDLVFAAVIWGNDAMTSTVQENPTLKKTTLILTEASYAQEIRWLELSIMFGSCGTSIQGITSLTVWLSRQKIDKSYLLSYLNRPLIGAALAVVTYLLLRVILSSTTTRRN